jgi:hypothetical protein
MQFFFNVPESEKSWVLRSASKKMKDFKCYLKSEYFDEDLSMRQNIANGCAGRVPPEQWKSLVEYWFTEKAMV